MSGKISVLMGIYNCADTLEQAVLSIQNQTYSNWELILCDTMDTGKRIPPWPAQAGTPYRMNRELSQSEF